MQSIWLVKLKSNAVLQLQYVLYWSNSATSVCHKYTVLMLIYRLLIKNSVPLTEFFTLGVTYFGLVSGH